MSSIPEELATELAERLRARRSELLNEISAQLSSEGREQLHGMYSGARDQGDESVADLLADLGIATMRAEASELADIEAALNRLNNRTFGVCVDCGEDIAPERLQAYPTAKRCVECQKQHETTRGGKDRTPSL